MLVKMETGASGGGGITKEEFTINTVANVNNDTGIPADDMKVVLLVCNANPSVYRVCCEIENGTITSYLYNMTYIRTSILPNGNLAINPDNSSIAGTYSVTLYK